ncbi:MAG TPA: hypothetical protein VD846_10905 [Allosphingosinicella sp.]|nr:hypothetical protein [Allosphingosinicella sp.]
MNNYINRSSVAVLCAMMTLACSANTDTIQLVTPEAYSSNKCWIDQNGEISAFLVLAEEGNMRVPYLISARCMIEGDYSSQGEAVLHHLNTIRLVDSRGTLQRILPKMLISNNLRTDQPVPSSGSELYYFRAETERMPHSNKNVYVPLKIHQFTKLNMPFEKFLALSKNDRISLLQL